MVGRREMRHGRRANKYLEACWRATAKSSIKILVHFPSSIGILVHFSSSLRIPVHFFGSIRIPVHFLGSFRIPVHFLGSFKIPTPFLRTHSTEIFLRIPETAGFKYVYFYLIPQEPFYLDKSTTGAIFVPQEPPFT